MVTKYLYCGRLKQSRNCWRYLASRSSRHMLGKRIVSPVAEFCVATFFYNKVGCAPMFSVEKVQLSSDVFLFRAIKCKHSEYLYRFYVCFLYPSILSCLGKSITLWSRSQ